MYEFFWPAVYIGVGVCMLLITHRLEDYRWWLFNYSDGTPLDDSKPLGFIVFVAIWPLGLLYLGSIILECGSILRIQRRVKPKREQIKALDLKKLQCIKIIYNDGSSYKVGGYVYLDESLSRLHWIAPGNQLSAGGWDMNTSLMRIAKVEVVKPGDPHYTPPNYPWW